jgi:hypothetical protein
MHRFVSPFVLGFAVLCATAGAAGAQSIPDMKGVWTGTSKSIVSGPAPYHPATIASKPAGPNRLTEVEFIMTIQGQQDVRFWGTRGSTMRVEPVIGVISADGKRIRVVPESGGLIEGTFVDNDSIEIFYTENKNGESVAATNVFKRKK